MNPRILGFVMARDEWPLLGISILNAFRRGVDHIVVLNHASVDNTADGLARISELYPNKLTVFEMHDGSVYLQEASVSLALAHVDTASFDWVYVFDADEILITAEGLPLPEILKAIPKETTSVRYHIDQWVWPRGFDEDSPRSYLHVTARAVPSVFLDMAPELKIFELKRGTLNYFDIPFPSKLIVRPEHLWRLFAGAHHAEGLSEHLFIEKHQGFVAHIPLRSLEQLENKARQGTLLSEWGFPRHHGWQNQVLAEMRDKAELADHWLRHSVDLTNNQNSMALGHPKITPDMRLREAISVVVKELSNALRGKPRNDVSRRDGGAFASLESLPINQSLKSVHQKTIQRDEALRQRDFALQERDQALAQLDAMSIELSLAIERLSAIQSTRSWRWTSTLRKVFGRR